MSAANSAAKKRRAPPSIEPPRVGGGGPGGMGPGGMGGPGAGVGGPAPTTGLTLPQVIALIDKRLVNLETITKDKILSGDGAEEDGEEGSAGMGGGVDPAVLDEFNARFEIMAEEIANIKSIVLSLQSYTMNVNKMLLEERAAGVAAGVAAAAVAPVVEAPGVTLEPEGANNDPLEEVVPQTPKWKKLK